MPLIGVLNTMVDGTFVTAAPHNSNYDAIKTAFNASAVLTDVVKTITVSHNWNAVQNFAGGITGNVTGNVTGNLTGTVLTASQPNITSLGSLTGLTVAGLATINRLAGGSATPTLTIGAGWGATATKAIVGTDAAGQITINSAGAGVLGGVDYVTITFSTAYPAAPYVILYPANAAARDMAGTLVVGTRAAGSVSFSGGAPVAGTTYIWNYIVIG